MQVCQPCGDTAQATQAIDVRTRAKGQRRETSLAASLEGRCHGSPRKRPPCRANVARAHRRLRVCHPSTSSLLECDAGSDLSDGSAPLATVAEQGRSHLNRRYLASAETSIELRLIPAALTARMTK
jgi:hypothetical protein